MDRGAAPLQCSAALPDLQAWPRKARRRRGSEQPFVSHILFCEQPARLFDLQRGYVVCPSRQTQVSPYLPAVADALQKFLKARLSRKELFHWDVRGNRFGLVGDHVPSLADEKRRVLAALWKRMWLAPGALVRSAHAWHTVGLSSVCRSHCADEPRLHCQVNRPFGRLRTRASDLEQELGLPPGSLQVRGLSAQTVHSSLCLRLHP